MPRRGSLIFPLAALMLAACAHPNPSLEDGMGGSPGDGGHRDLGAHGDLGDAGVDLAMSANQCPGKNLQTDPMNCGSCAHQCMGTHVAMNACMGGSCAIGMCSPGYFDVNGMAGDGCECQADAAQNSSTRQCQGAVSAGTVTDAMASMITLTGNVVPLGDEVWYEIKSVDDPEADGGCNKYHLKIAFADNPKMQFRFDLYYADCTTAASCNGMAEGPAGLTDYDFDANNDPMGGNECPCSNSAMPPMGQHQCIDHSQTLRMRVYRVMNAPLSCDNYKIVVSNGM